MTDAPHETDLDRFYTGLLKRAEPNVGLPPLAPDYAGGALDAIPAEIVGSSFGCGNPLAFARVCPGQTVLDLGCGTGMDLLLAADRVGPEGSVIGVDRNPDLLAQARRNLDDASVSDADLLEGSIEHLPLKDASVDWVISNCVINLSPDKPAVFREIARVLKPGGGFLISDLVADDLPDWIQAHRDLYAACLSGAVSEAGYLSHASQAGLSELSVVDRLAYDAALVRGLVETELPVALDCLADRLKLSTDALLDRVAESLAGKIVSIKLSGRRHAAP